MDQGPLQSDRAVQDREEQSAAGQAPAGRGRCCVVLGGAPSWAAEYAAIRPDLGDHVAIAANDVGVLFPGPLLAWASLHPEKLGHWRGRRQGTGPAHVFSPDRHRDDGGLTLVREKWSGSSGLYAVQIAIDVFGLNRIVLCGVPIEADAGHIRGVEHWDDAPLYRQGWLRARPHIADRVRSMSGWTRELLGYPDRDWLSL